jgi:DNA-binding winged helix-turn-helix (wHTH) protein
MFTDRDTTLDSSPANIEETVADRSQPAAHYIELSSLSSQKTGPCASGFEKIIGNGRADCAGLTRLPKIQIPRASHSREILLAGDLKMDLDRHSLWKANEKIHLTPKEFELLSYLFENQGALVTHVKLLHRVWGPEHGNELEYPRTYIRILRKKIEDDPAKPQYILTEPWAGYRFRNPSDRRAQKVSEKQGQLELAFELHRA